MNTVGTACNPVVGIRDDGGYRNGDHTIFLATGGTVQSQIRNELRKQVQDNQFGETLDCIA